MGSPRKSTKRKNFDVEGSPEAKKARSNSDERNEPSQEVTPTAGRVKKMYLRNIMCHEALEVDFNQSVNFIVGKNGSGKSAILASLQIGLGAKAKVTNRGKSCKSIMKDGCNKSSIEITLTNVGALAYKPEIYGDTIKVIRQINNTPSGEASQYKILNSRGKIISYKKRELNMIVSCMNIQPENPISLMSQEMSKEFLKNSTDSNRYQLFMQATQLDVIGDNYKEAQIESEEARMILEETSSQLKKEQKEIDEIERKIGILDSLVDKRAEYESLQIELKWASAIHEEEMLAKIEEEFEKAKQILEEREAAQLNEGTRIVDIETKIKQLQKEVDSLDSASQGARERYSDVRDEYNGKRIDLDNKKTHLKEVIRKSSHYKGEVTTLTREIERLESGNSKMEQERKQQKEELAKCAAELEQIEAMITTSKVTQQHLQSGKIVLEKDEHSLKMERQRKLADCDKITRSLRGLQQSTDSISVFGSNIPRLLKRIEEEHKKGRFRQKPVGPLGSYIKVKDQSWIPAVEAFLGRGFITGFCVDNSQDLKLLSLLIKEIFYEEIHPEIICCKFRHQVHDVSRTSTGTDRFPNLFHAMEISNPVVANCIIDQRDAETVLLIPSSAEAVGVMQHAANVPRNCRRAITKKNDLFFPDPKYRTYGGQVSKPKWLQVSTKEAIQALTEELNILEREKVLINDQYNTIRVKLEESSAEYKLVQRKLSQLQTKKNQLKSMIEKLNDAVVDEYIDNFALFNQEKVELEAKLTDLNAQEAALNDDIAGLESEVKALGGEVNRSREAAYSHKDRVHTIKQTIEQLQLEKGKIKCNTSSTKSKVQRARDEVENAKETLNNQRGYTANAIAEAEDAGPRMATERTAQQITHMCQTVKSQIHLVEKQTGSREELQKQLEEKQSKNQSIIEFYRKIYKVNKKHLKRVEERRLEFQKLKKIAGRRVREAFNGVLSMRNYDGSITIDHANKKLLLSMLPRSGMTVEHGGLHTLSGGERSYSTVAFVLALWECTTCPFYFLDEFDVFMDKLNRRVIMEILLTHAKEHPEKQFGLLTPLDTSVVTASDTLTIHQMEPPIRTDAFQVSQE